MSEPWLAAEPTAGFIADVADAHPGLPPMTVVALHHAEAEERAAEQRRHDELEERREQPHNRAIAESISRSHAHGEAWRPDDPWRHYPDRETRIAEAFAVMDAQAAAELRQAKAEAARVLREHGVHAQVVVDANDHPSARDPGH
jgi:hypothetical protein